MGRPIRRPSDSKDTMITLDFGCRMEKVKGAIGVDIDPSVNPDVIWDFNAFPYPFANDYADRIYAKHIIEHLDQPKHFIEEIIRILKPGGIAYLETPHFSNYVAYSEPQHKFFYSYFTFRNLTSAFKEAFNVVEWRLSFYKTFRYCGIAALANANPENYERFWTYFFPAESVVFSFKKAPRVSR